MFFGAGTDIFFKGMQMQQSGLSQLTILHLTQKEEMTERRG